MTSAPFAYASSQRDIIVRVPLGESLRISTGLRALRPRVAVGMQANASNSYDATSPD